MSIETWEITLPDGTHILDEIEYGLTLSVAGVSLAAKQNRRTITYDDGDIDIVAVPENFAQNRQDLENMVNEWLRAKKVFNTQAQKREELYIIYKQWLNEHLRGNSLSTLLFSTAGGSL